MEYLDCVFICACMYVMCYNEAQRLHGGGHCSSVGEVGWSGCDDGPVDDPWLSSRQPGFSWGVGSGSAGVISDWAIACEDEGLGVMFSVSEEEEEDNKGLSVGDWLLDSVTSGEGEEEEDEDDDDEVFICWEAEGTPEEEELVSPADMTGPLCRSCSPVPSSFPSSGRAPSSCFLLAVASSWPAGLWLAAGASWLGTVVVGDWLLSCEWQRGQVSWT